MSSEITNMSTVLRQAHNKLARIEQQYEVALRHNKKYSELLRKEQTKVLKLQLELQEMTEVWSHAESFISDDWEAYQKGLPDSWFGPQTQEESEELIEHVGLSAVEILDDMSRLTFNVSHRGPFCMGDKYAIVRIST